jgi:hypothetical protein
MVASADNKPAAEKSLRIFEGFCVSRVIAGEYPSMHLKSTLSTIVVTVGLLVAVPAFAQHDHHAAPSKGEADAKVGQLIKVTKEDAVWAAKERASYPLDVCVSSGEKLGTMGKSAEYIYRVTGKPDRLVVFCCAGCDEDFLKDPEKHLATIDAARASKASDSKDAHKGHH